MRARRAPRGENDVLRRRRTGFQRFGDDAAVLALIKQGEDLQRLRNHVSFHMLEMVPQRSLPTLRLAEYVLVSGAGESGGSVHYDLADTVAAHYVCGCPADGHRFESELLRIRKETRQLATQFLESGDMLMKGALRHYKVRVKVGPRPAPLARSGEAPLGDDR